MDKKTMILSILAVIGIVGIVMFQSNVLGNPLISGLGFALSSIVVLIGCLVAFIRF
ncbi:MAG: hypothetical protein HPY60_04375 [Candidatus Methanofastidiosum sp.]|nr:hypothetical protein [Methanofastidiosum sp.]